MSFGRGALILLITSGISYVLGLLRDRILAGTYGASDVMDAYQAAFVIPDFIFNLFVAGALTAAFIPVFTDLSVHKKRKQAAEVAGTVLALGLVVLLVVGSLAWLLAGPLTGLVAPGFDDDKRALLTNLTRIMLLSPLLFFASNLLGGMLVSTKRFLYYGLSPALYNLGIIVGTLSLAPTLGIYSTAIGTIIGAALHLFIRFIDVRRAGLALLPSFTITPAVKTIGKLMVPRMVGLTAFQVQLWVFVAIASTLGEGAVTIYSLARNFQSFPVSLIGIAFATSLFPILAERASRKERREYTQELLRGTAVTLLAVVPAAILIYILRVEIIAFFVGTGRFDAAAVALTAATLGIYTLSIPTESMVHILARGFYALHNTLIPVAVSVFAILLSTSSSYLFAQEMGVLGIPAGFALGTAVQAVLLVVLLRVWTNRTLTSAR